MDINKELDYIDSQNVKLQRCESLLQYIEKALNRAWQASQEFDRWSWTNKKEEDMTLHWSHELKIRKMAIERWKERYNKQIKQL